MDDASLEQQAVQLMEKLTRRLDQPTGTGYMSVAVYDTAWVSMVQKTTHPPSVWLFPQCFRYVLEQQQSDGAWPCYHSQIDGILNTAASLLSLCRHRSVGVRYDWVSPGNISNRIDSAIIALQRLLDGWDVGKTLHVGFEIIVPALLEYLVQEGLNFHFPGKDLLLRINRQKLAKFEPETLYGPNQLTALHSLEAFIGKIDFNKIRHHKVNGSFLASPSSTAAYLANASEWDIDCEAYLWNVIENGSGQSSGGVPSAFPSSVFELTWSVSTLLQADFDLATLAPTTVGRMVAFLQNCFDEGDGCVGFGPGLCEDADDTSKAMLVLHLLGYPRSFEGLCQRFETKQCFLTYPSERDSSLSANCNVLIALVHSLNPGQYEHQILKILKFLILNAPSNCLELRDKWSVSPYYPLMLLSQAMADLTAMTDLGRLAFIPAVLKSQLLDICTSALLAVVRSQNANGSWGIAETREESAYAILTLANSITFIAKELRLPAEEAINAGRKFLETAPVWEGESLWVEKVTFASGILQHSYILAAMHKRLPTNPSINAIPEFLETTKERRDDHDRDCSPALANGSGLSLSVDAAASKHMGENMEGSGLLQNGNSACSASGDGSMDSRISGPTLWTERLLPWDETQEGILLEPLRYLEKQPGKAFRSSLIAALNEWLHIPSRALATIERAVGMLHTASMLVDDIEDSSELRRGVPVAHRVFGVPHTINSANYVYFLALQEVSKLNATDAVGIAIEEIIDLHRGQGLDLHYRDTLTCPTEEQYYQMVAMKTGGLFRLAARLMQAESPLNRDVLPLMRLLGLLFQICDDLRNLTSLGYSQAKGFCEDLTEGKFSFPMIHHLRSAQNSRELLNILQQRTRDEDLKRHAVRCLEDTGSFEYTRMAMADLGEASLKLIESYENQGWKTNEAMRSILAVLSRQ